MNGMEYCQKPSTDGGFEEGLELNQDVTYWFLMM